MGVLEGSAVELALVLLAADELWDVVVEDEVVTGVLLVELEVEIRVLERELEGVVVGGALDVVTGLVVSAAESPKDHVPCKVPTLT